MPNIILNGKVLSFDTILYIDNDIGNDTTGNGSKDAPYLTLTKAHQFHDGNTAYILGDGIYDSVNLNNTKYNNSSITYIGKGLYTTFRLTGTLTSTNNGIILLECKIYFYKLIFDGNNLSGPNSFILYSNLIEFNNIVFIKIANDNYGYFNAAGTSAKLVMNNCIKPITSSEFIAYTTIPAELNYCYGGFTAGYRSSLADIDKIDNVITSNPQLDASYNITESLSANIGVYNGQYKWIVSTVKAILDKNYINSKNDKISLTITDITPLTDIDTSSFKVLLNKDTIYSNPITLSFPQKINLSFTEVSELLNSNSLYIILNTSRVFTLKLYYEGDGLLNPITRDFKNIDWVDKSNVALIPRTGVSLTNQNRQGSVFTDISVYKKAEVKKVTVDGDNDKVITGNYTFKPNYIEDYFFKNVITRSPGSKFTTMNYLNTSLLYMKECIELPGNITMTDNDDTTATSMAANNTRTWLLSSAEILSLYIKPSGKIRIDIYNSLNIIIYTNTISTATVMTINKSDICKIVITNTYGAGINLFTVSAIGYDNKKFHLYSNPKYNIYAPVNASVSKLVLEDTIVITKDLVKSKKMGNLAFINNPSKVVIKKASSSSSQTSSKIVRNKIDLTNIPMRKIEVK